jgi:predicted GNAT superfamily acetyltransferase
VRVVQAEPEHFAALLRLNEESVSVLAPLSRDRLESLHRCAAYHKVVLDGGAVAGFLLAFADGSDHDSPNFRWFAERGGGFIYVDRVVVAASRRRSGVGSLLYGDLFALARDRGWDCVTCEIDADPPNPASERFHERLGFVEVGTQWVEYEAGHPKQVSLRELRLEAASR